MADPLVVNIPGQPPAQNTAFLQQLMQLLSQGQQSQLGAQQQPQAQTMPQALQSMPPIQGFTPQQQTALQQYFQNDQAQQKNQEPPELPKSELLPTGLDKALPHPQMVPSFNQNNNGGRNRMYGK